MLQALLRASSLPSLHPAIVHFPIVLLALAPLVDSAALALRRQKWLVPAGVLMWVLAAIAGGLAFWSGERAEASAAITDAMAMADLEAHATAAGRTAVGAGIAAVLRIGLAIAARLRPGLAVAGAWLGVGSGIALVGLVAVTADLGGRLVYRHGVGVAASAEELVPAPSPAPLGP